MNYEIIILDSHTASKIAAGEVVERPLNAVKELLENSLDAGASKIILELVSGGTELIRVTDDGKGIKPDDLHRCLERFATSKASCVEDVYNISTYGFRGEALAAISAVSDFTIKSARSGFEPSQLRSHFGKVSAVIPAAIDAGTQISVENIFENLPVRKKFLKGQRSNEQEILKFVKQLSFHNSDVQFIVSYDGKEVYRTYPGDSMLDIAKKVFAEDRLVYVEDECAHSDSGVVRVRLCASNPAVQRKRRDGILIGVNGRVIKDHALTQAVVQAYHRNIPQGMYPYALVDISISPSLVDVNIHPAKAEVRFQLPSLIFSAVQRTAGQAIEKFNVGRYDLEPERCYTDDGYLEDRRRREEKISTDGGASVSKADACLAPTSSKPQAKAEEFVHAQNLQDGGRESFTRTVDISASIHSERGLSGGMKHSFYDITKELSTFEDTGVVAYAKHKNPVSEEREGSTFTQPDTGHRVVGQISRTYIICESPTGDLVIIDQHVAHERVLYEKYTAERLNTVASVTLFEPVVLELEADEYDFLMSVAADIERFGYRFELFGGSSVKINMVPADTLKKDAKTEFTGILHDSMELRKSHSTDCAIVTMSCRNAVKAGDLLSVYEMQHLVDKLFMTNNPYTCPHGRPIVYSMKAGELAKKFQR
ncbi:hypothetical protein AAG570_014019 [Ranatra chinensis]|uniref:DNA mismatch repair protein MutL n=1 Tax=Ranatra chinensis TaxID=642074 RepID=A0ABD0Y5H4_9HEMI